MIRDRPEPRKRKRKLTVRARLTLTYTLLLAACVLIMASVVYLFMSYVPRYDFIALSDSFEPPARSDEVVTGPTTQELLTLSSVTDILNTLLIASILILVLVVVVGAIAAWIIAGRMLRPLQAINAAAQRAGTGSFDHRVGLSGPHDEITELSDTIDTMLERLERSFQAHRHFAANASHELRTPLATNQAMLDIALSDPEQTTEQFRELAQRLRDTNTRSIETVDALLELADVGERGIRVERVDLEAVIAQTLGDFRDAINSRSIAVDTKIDAATVEGDPALIRHLVSNLIDNAIKHNQEGGTVSISVRTDAISPKRVRLTVENSGRPVPEESLRFLTEPFYRGGGRVTVDGQRSRGLGLAIVDSIVAAHHGELAVEGRREGGLTVTVSLVA